MAEAPRYVIHSNTLLHTRAHWARSVDAAQALLIPDAKYSNLNKWWLKFEPLTSFYVGSDIIPKNQLN